MNCPKLKQKYEEMLTLQNEFQGVLATFQNMKSNTPDERNVLVIELNRLQSECGKFIDENFDFIWKDKIIKKQKEALETFFQKIIDVPAIPEGISREQIEKWEKMGIELVYLPEEDMTEDKDAPGWIKKPTNLFSYIKIGNVSSEATKIKAGWRLMDKTRRPQYDSGRQMYEKDPLKDAITELRENDHIAKWDGRDSGSRFHLSNDELQKTEVKIAFAKVLGVEPTSIRLPKAIEWNVVSNIHHSEWGETNYWEWYSDECVGGCRLLGGHFADGGLSDVNYASSSAWDDRIGFRVVIDLH